MKFTLAPLVGALPLRFGMTAAEVASIVGQPERVTRTSLGEREEQRAGVMTRYSQVEDAVIEFSFLPTENLLLDGINLFQTDDPIQRLRKADPNPFEWVGFIIFLSLGVSVTGYHDSDHSQRAITVSERGRWEAYQHHFVPFKK